MRAGIDAVNKPRLRRGVDLIEQGERRLIFECGEKGCGAREGLAEQRFATGKERLDTVGAASCADYGCLLAEQAAAGRQGKIRAG